MILRSLDLLSRSRSRSLDLVSRCLGGVDFSLLLLLRLGLFESSLIVMVSFLVDDFFVGGFSLSSFISSCFGPFIWWNSCSLITKCFRAYKIIINIWNVVPIRDGYLNLKTRNPEWNPNFLLPEPIIRDVFRFPTSQKIRENRTFFVPEPNTTTTGSVGRQPIIEGCFRYYPLIPSLIKA